MPAGTNPALSRAIGALRTQAWLQTLLRPPAEMQRRPSRVRQPTRENRWVVHQVWPLPATARVRPARPPHRAPAKGRRGRRRR